jgi:CRISPR-associated exonuclease Cas4
MMYTESELQPISALQHLLFCPRQWGLIHLEKIWVENRLTAEGRVLHERVHKDKPEQREGVRIVRGLRIHSFELGLIGQADVVEFQQDQNGVMLPGFSGRWLPYPVEYKRGKPKANNSDVVQLCAQALCLEEMLGVAIPEGALYYGQPRKRSPIVLNQAVRQETIALIHKLHQLYEERKTPTVRYSKKCDNCSLVAVCMPKITGVQKKVKQYIESSVQEAEE